MLSVGTLQPRTESFLSFQVLLFLGSTSADNFASTFGGGLMHGRDALWALTNLVDRPRLFVEQNSLGFLKAEMLILLQGTKKI